MSDFFDQTTGQMITQILVTGVGFVLAGLTFAFIIVKPARESTSLERIEGVGEWVCITKTEEWGKNPITKCIPVGEIRRR